MNVLVSGGAGYLGSHVVEELKARGADVTVLDSLSFCDYYDVVGVRFVRWDVVADRPQMPRLLKGLKPDCVVWLAGVVGDAACASDPARARAVNVDSVAWLAEDYRGRVVFPSSCSVYGAMDGVATENSPFNPLSIYAETKIAAEGALKGRPDTYVFRLGTLHGVSRRMRFDLIVNAMTRRAVARGQVQVYGGRQHRPLLHVSDAACALADAAMEGGAAGTYNLATENLSVLDVAGKVAGATGAAIVTTETRYEDNRDYRADSGKALREFPIPDWTDVEQSAGEITSLLRSGRIRDPLDRRYYNDQPPEE